ncbi:MAG: GTPase ObgE [Candidatus Omnitrophota bacterium]|nr:GTPase ObgE [Candidatus Omnitrophota bacterium]
MFIDRASIFVKAGDGGDGSNSFCKIKGLKRRQDGGDGGKGGDIVLIADKNVQTLLDFHFRRHFRADKGLNGSGNNRKGAAAVDCIVRLPLGTIVKDKYEDIAYCDLKESGQSVILIKGGLGGHGNSKFRQATAGDPGEEKEITLELKLIADVGIIGYPNAGKSSLISVVSKAKSKVANYPFTTKTPVLGVVRLSGERSFVICDIPGLIEGAHAGKGLGDDFLRHVERTRVLIHMIDMAGVDCRDPADDFKSINNELKLYNPELVKRPQVIAVNKMDIPEAMENLKKFKKKVKKTVYPISCVTGEGIKELLEAVYKRLLGVAKRA